MPNNTSMSAVESLEPDDHDFEEFGRCVYCGERCNYDATEHERCRREYEIERYRPSLERERPAYGGFDD